MINCSRLFCGDWKKNVLMFYSAVIELLNCILVFILGFFFTGIVFFIESCYV